MKMSISTKSTTLDEVEFSVRMGYRNEDTNKHLEIIDEKLVQGIYDLVA